MEKLLIGSLELSTTQGGKPIVELYSTNTALQFPELRLFDLSALVAVGIDPNNLVQGERIHRRFWAYYTVSDKTNSRGNPYKDVAHLEALEQPATATSTDTTALLRELRSMNALLYAIADKVGAIAAPNNDPDAIEDPVQRAIVEATAGEKPAETADTILDPTRPHRERYRYANGLACTANEHERQAFEAYVQAENARPADVDALRAWVQDTPKPREG